jgi:hypothetical protein
MTACALTCVWAESAFAMAPGFLASNGLPYARVVMVGYVEVYVVVAPSVIRV